jgi:Tfp pilus assembly protein PilX
MNRHSQRGATLLIGLIMLVLMTLLAVSAFNLSKSNLKVVGNMQNHNEAVSTAKSAIEEVLSKTDFAANPAAAFGTGNVKSYDINGDGNNDVTVTMVPQPCIKSYQILPADPNDPTSQGCAASVQQNFGVSGSATWGSQCADIVWEVTAVAKDNVTGATATVGQGIRIRDDASSAVNAANYCP